MCERQDINWKHSGVKTWYSFAQHVVQMESRPCSCQVIWQKQAPFSWLQFSETLLYSLRTFNLFLVSPKLPFQTTQVTLTHNDNTTGFDSWKLKLLKKFRHKSLKEVQVNLRCTVLVLKAYSVPCVVISTKDHRTKSQCCTGSRPRAEKLVGVSRQSSHHLSL